MATSTIKANVITGYGSIVNLSSYSSSNQYTVPNDGLVFATANYRANSYCQVFIDGNQLLQASTGANGASGNTIVSIPVFRGQKVYAVTESGNYSGASYRPFTRA